MLRYMRPAGGGLAAVSLATSGAYFVAVITAGYPLPWWRTSFCSAWLRWAASGM